MENLIQHYLEIILLVYAFALFVLSIVIYVLPKDRAQSSWLPNLSLIALFGVLHGIHEFIQWQELRYSLENSALHELSEVLTIGSYLALLEFGRRLICQKRQAQLGCIPPLYGFIGCTLLLVVFFDNGSLESLTIALRLLLGVTGSIITGIVLLKYNLEHMHPNVKYALHITGGSFIMYGMSILVLSNDHSIFAQSLPTYASFLAITHIPIHLIRTFFILIIAISLTYIVRSLNFQSRQHELQTISEVSHFNGVLEQRIKKKTAKLRQLVIRLREDINQRKQIQQRLQDKEQMLSQSQRIAHIGSWSLDLITQQISWSDEMYRIYGVTPETFEHSFENFLDLIHPDDQTTMKHWFSDCLAEKQPKELDFRIVLADGRVRFIRGYGGLQYDEMKKPLRMIGGAQDITERKLLEMEREQFFKFFNLAPILQCIVGLDGYFKQVNPAFTQKLGFLKEEWLQIPFIEFVFPEDREKTLEKVRKLQNREVIIDFENRYLCKDGSQRWLSWKAVFEPTDQLIYATARDISEAKKNEEKLQLAEMVYQHSIQAILVTDANNHIVATNPAFTEITGYTLDEVIGKNPNIFKSGQHPPEFYQSMWQEINTQGHWQGEIWDKCKNGNIHAKFLNINRILDKNGQVHRYLALFSDITARKQYEDEIKRLSESELNKAKLEAERASQAKNDFLASMSHELFTPMNAVLGFAQILEYEDLTTEQRENVVTILTGGYQLLDLIKEVLDLSKMESEKLELRPELLDLGSLVKNCITLMQPLTFKNNIQMVDNLTVACQVNVLADSLRLKQVLLNLISNAIKYNRVEGRITLSCETVTPQTIRVNISDTGIGLSELQLAKLFQPFERLTAKNSAIEGAGLGLCISKKLIEGMKGTMGVSSQVGEGSCFWIEIPLA